MITVWPTHWPRYFNGGNQPCDMAIGPCACGAYHDKGEFTVSIQREVGILYRFGKSVLRFMPEFVHYERGDFEWELMHSLAYDLGCHLRSSTYNITFRQEDGSIHVAPTISGGLAVVLNIVGNEIKAACWIHNQMDNRSFQVGKFDMNDPNMDTNIIALLKELERMTAKEQETYSKQHF